MSDEEPPAVPPSEVYVRMYRALERDTVAPTYRGLLGDCFLIRLIEGGQASHILIDCGILLGSPQADARMREVAADIVDCCGGNVAAGIPGTLDLLVVTHEHYDHISGFSAARDILLDPARLRIAKIWMAWTENPNDDTAQGLRQRFDKSATRLAMIAERVEKDGQVREAALGARAAAEPGGSMLQSLAGFLGPSEVDKEAAEKADTLLGAAAGARPRKLKTREIMEHLKALALPGAPDYLMPGTVRQTPGKVGVRAFVLGPPRNLERLFKDKPSSVPEKQETYFGELMDGGQLLGYAEGATQDPSKLSPFAASHCALAADDPKKALHLPLDRPPAKDAAHDDCTWLRANYRGVAGMGAEAKAALARRRIDDDWLSGVGALALKLDSDTNNTSLVLAFELPDETMMLFAADAQVGNWESWHDQRYPLGDGTELNAEALLNRTRFYKVGHHGSHNATLSKRGLEMMTHPDLVAAIPTDEELGKGQGSHGWLMPNPRVAAALRARTKGRILRNDRRYTPEARAEDLDREFEGVEDRFFEAITDRPLYVEFRLLPQDIGD